MFIFDKYGLSNFIKCFFFLFSSNKLLEFACLLYYITLCDHVACIIILLRQIYTSIVWFCLTAHIEITKIF